MTTSGINTFNLARDQIIDMALEEIGIKTLNRIPTTAQVQQAAMRLNTMIKHWKIAGINLWKSEQGTLFTTVGQARYRLDGSTASATQSYTAAAISTNAVSGATSLTLTSVSGSAIGYYVFIIQDNNTSLSATINNIVGNTITISTALTDDVTSGNAIFIYQTKINRPEEISNVRTQLDSSIEIPCAIYSQDSYFSLAVKNIQAIPNVAYYDKQLNYGDLYLWPTPQTNTYFVNFTFQKQFDDFVSPINTPDFPQEWLRALYLNLAVDLLGPYGKNDQDYTRLIAIAKMALDECNSYDREDTSFYMQPASTQNLYTYR